MKLRAKVGQSNFMNLVIDTLMTFHSKVSRFPMYVQIHLRLKFWVSLLMKGWWSWKSLENSLKSKVWNSKFKFWWFNYPTGKNRQSAKWSVTSYRALSSWRQTNLSNENELIGELAIPVTDTIVTIRTKSLAVNELVMSSRWKIQLLHSATTATSRLDTRCILDSNALFLLLICWFSSLERTLEMREEIILHASEIVRPTFWDSNFAYTVRKCSHAIRVGRS